jgi:hypothetical protein
MLFATVLFVHVRNDVPNDAVPNDAVPNDAVPNDAVPNDAVPNDTLPPSELIVGEPYAVAVDSEHTEFDLNFASNTRYLVVIGSLGSSERPFEVGCSSRTIPALRLGPANRVLPLGNSRWGQASAREGQRNPPLEDGRNDQKDRLRDVIPASLSRPEAKATSGPLHEPIAGGQRTFSLHVTDGSLDDPAQYVTIHARAIGEGRQVRVYLDDQQSPSDLAPGLVRDVVDLFDGDIIPRFRGVLGTYRDVDHDGRFAVLLSPWLSRLQGGRTSVGGFVRGSDFQSCLGLPFSNRCDMMYVNSQTLPGPHLRTLLIHEYTHAVCFSRRPADAGGRPQFPEEEDWLNEAIAHCAESLFQGGWSNLDYRIARFLNDPAAFPLVVGDYYRAGLWRCHGCRGATYLFLRYCLERFSPETLTRIIGNAAHGTHNIELATGCSFDRLFRGWTLSLIDAALRGTVPDAPEAPAGDMGESAALAPLDLYGSLGEWGLAGPQRQIWNVDAGPQHVELRGTSARYVELFAAGHPGPRRLSLQASRGSQLQVSVVRLADDSPRIEVEAAWSESSAGQRAVSKQAAAVQPAGDRLHTLIRVVGGKDLTIRQIAAEQNSAETHTSICFANAELAALECAPRTKTGKAAQSQLGETYRAFDLPTGRFSAGDLPIIVKVVAADRQGRRTSAWSIVSPHAPTESERLAQHVR